MRRGRGVRHETLRIAEIVRDVDEPQRVEKAKAALLAAGDVKADEAAALLHLPTREIVLRVAWQPGVKHPRDLGMGLETAGDGNGGTALAVDAELKRLQPFKQQPSVERAERRPGMSVEGAEIVLDE